MRSLASFNDAWIFHEGFSPDLVGTFREGEAISLPHNAVELPFNYFDETCYQRAFTYQKVLAWQPDFAGREVSLVFDAAMADAVVYLNGKKIIAHKDGYTPFEARLTGLLTRRRQPDHRQDRRQREPRHPALRRPDRLSHLCRHLPRCRG